jgi:hypothetical protein
MLLILAMWLPNFGYLQDAAGNQDVHGWGYKIGDACLIGFVYY